ncbi:EAL domain-containing protein [Colwellia sp. 1_MG-2023]|uniref:EAL domain-containing protein n=1 Tax=Colwellia sp. 1_MG-2023 TaxID=3062649 RepID=UPI0026E2CFD3|nr:GGDEF domain-containing phosphodiesterase [Colwellia sp. 1_MG-2023]MDO6444890.1 EAL domain-containing protein [Colwellia sp. 1_MG-2023]
MHNSTFRFRVVLKQFWLAVSSFFFVQLPVSASAQIESLPTYSFAEFSIAFILGLSLPLLIIMALLKPLLLVKWRLLSLLTLALLFQFYSFSYLTQWQHSALLISAAIFVLSAFLWLQTNLTKHRLTHPLIWLMVGVCCSFISAIFFLREIDVFQLWLVFLALFTGATVMTALKSQANKASKIRISALCIAFVCYGVALYFWLNVQASITLVITLSVLSYLFAIINGCWGIVDVIQGKLNDFTRDNEREHSNANFSAITLDPITNLPSYQQSLFCLKRAISKKTERNFVAIVFKPLNFYQVNKVLGHQNSDILLLQLAFNLQKCVSNESLLMNFNDDTSPVRISRLQGLDFLIVLDASLSNHPVKIVVEDICQKLVTAVPQAMSFKSFSLNFELAFGVAISEGSKQDIEQLIAQASDALLSSESQHEMLSYFNPQTAIYTERQLAKMEKLKQDIIHQRITWRAQPQVSLITKQLKGFELSLEWQDNNGVRLSPHEFNEIAEFSGEIYQLTKQMITQAFQLLSTMHQMGIKESVAINLSSKDLLETELTDFIEQCAKKAAISVEYLIIELSEQVLLDSAFRARMMVDQLKAIGVKISIDNFSGSYESLRYLRRTSIQQVKIDCALLNNEQHAQSEKTIVNALINLIRKMDIPIVAVGINNRDIETSYLGIGGDIAQGNSIHQGLNINDVSTWLVKWQSNADQTA